MDVRAALERVREGVAALLALDPDAMGDAELTGAVVDLMGLRDRMAAASARLVAPWADRGCWADDGSRAAWARLAREARCSGATAQREIARAAALKGLPAVSAAFAKGELSTDVAGLFCECAGQGRERLAARDEAMLLERTAPLSYGDTRRVLSYWRHLADEELGKDIAAELRDGRQLYASRSFGGALELKGRLDPLDGEVVLSELERLEAELREKGHWGDQPLPRAKRLADALVEMARRSAGASATARPPAPLISILVGLETFTGRVCETERGTVVPPDLVRRYLEDADTERIVFDGPSRVIEVGARRRFFTGAARRAIEVRDRRCTHPGCEVPAHLCQVDHIVPVEHGGLTTLENGRLLCGYHNRWWWSHHQRHGPGRQGQAQSPVPPQPPLADEEGGFFDTG